MVYHRSDKLPRALLLTLVATAVIAALGCSRKESTQTMLTEAKTYQQKGENKAATIELKNVLQKDADSGEARYMLGTVYNASGDYQSAEKELRRALELGVEKSRVEVALGDALLKQGEYQKVLDEIKPDPAFKGATAADIDILRADAYLALGKIDNARSALDAARQQQPDSAAVYLGQARLAMARKDVEETLRQVNIALEKAPGNADGWRLKGDALRLQGKAADAVAAYRQSLQADAGNVQAHLALAAMEMAENRFDDARKETDAARKAAPNNLLVIYTSALVDFRQAKYPEAREQLQQVLKRVPNHMPSVLLSGATAYALGAYEQAEAALNKFLRRYPDSVYARKLLAATLLKTQRPEAALDILKPALSKQTRDPQLLVLAGEIHMAMKEYDKATDYLGKAVALDPRNVPVRTALGVSQLAGGDTEHALAAMESAAALDTGQYKADSILVQTYLRARQYDKALTAIAALEKKQPNNPETYNLKGGAYLGKGDVANARKCFEQAVALQPAFIDAVMNLAQLDIKDRHPDAARKRLETVLEKDQNNVVAMLALANLAVNTGQEQDYVTWLEKAAKAAPSALQPLSLLANYYVQKQQPEKALALARQAQTANQNSPDAMDLLGSVQLAAGEKDNAVATYTKLAALTPKSPQAQLKLAGAQAASQNIAAAEASLHQALELDPHYLEAQITLVSLEMRAGKSAEALKVAGQVQEQNPKAPLGFTLQGDVFMSQKQYPQAVAAYEQASRIGRSGLIVTKLHQAQILAGSVKDADTRLLQWLKEQPKDVAVRSYLAQSYMSRGLPRAAIEQYQSILQIQPDDPFALNNLAWLYHDAKDPRALAVAEQAYKVRPDAAFIADTLGWIALQQGGTARGVEILHKAVTLAPNNSEIGYHYAVALFKSGDKQQARKQLEAVLDSGKSFPEQDEAMALMNQL